MTTVFVLPLEKIIQRYTVEWYTSIPDGLDTRARERGLDVDIVNIDGVIPEKSTTTAGAFLEFADTNIWKASQAQRVAELFSQGRVKPGDVFLVTDIWHFGITAIKYMSDLLDIPVYIGAISHSGAFDKSDILGMKMQKPWPWHQERAWYYACDRVYYGTDFQREMFLKNLGIPEQDHGRAIQAGQPHSLVIAMMAEVKMPAKKQGVIWPHRYNADKQPDIAEDLVTSMNQPWCITQKMNLNKADYYNTLAQNQVLFSCSLHENLGISVMEGVLTNTIPVLPRRCSYEEMYLDEFLYPSEWTQDFRSYQAHKKQLVEFIQDRLDHPDKYVDAMMRQRRILEQKYLTAVTMFDDILQHVEMQGTNK